MVLGIPATQPTDATDHPPSTAPADSPEAQAARRRALEEALIGARSARRGRRAHLLETERAGRPGPETESPDPWPTAVLPGLPWTDQAACRGADPELFFGPDLLLADNRRERPVDRRRREARAKALCAACPVRLECAAHALSFPEPFGVWGGMGENERLVRQQVTEA